MGIRQIGPEELGDLGLGEREAIVLATEHGSGVLLIIDDAQGRLLASRRGIDTTGTLGVLDVAAEKGWLDLRTAISQLRRTMFYAKPSLYERLLDGILSGERFERLGRIISKAELTTRATRFTRPGDQFSSRSSFTPDSRCVRSQPY